MPRRYTAALRTDQLRDPPTSCSSFVAALDRRPRCRRSRASRGAPSASRPCPRASCPAPGACRASRPAMRQNRLAAGAGVAADQAFDVHCRSRHAILQRLAPRRIARPRLDAERFLRARLSSSRFAATSIIALLGRRERPRLARRSRRSPVRRRRHQRVERLHEVPRRAVDRAAMLECMSLRRAAAPLRPLAISSHSMSPWRPA